MKAFSLSLLLGILIIVISSCNQNQKSNNDIQNSETSVDEPKNVVFNSEEFFMAALNGDLNKIHKAISNGTNPDIIDTEQRTALLLASYNGHSEIVKLLIKKGANVNHADVNNRTALMFAATGPFEQTVIALLKAGANINTADNIENFTPLMFAASEGQTAIVKILLDNGADKKMLDIDGDNAYNFALANKHTETAELLK